MTSDSSSQPYTSNGAENRGYEAQLELGPGTLGIRIRRKPPKPRPRPANPACPLFWTMAGEPATRNADEEPILVENWPTFARTCKTAKIGYNGV